MATSRKCHEGRCGPCFLCNAQSTKFTHPQRFKTEEYTFLCKYEEREIDATVCICYPCYKQIQRNINNSGFKPRWQKHYTETTVCGIEGCKREAIKNTHLASREDIEHILNQLVISFTVEDDQTSVPLCQSCYNEVYTHLNLSLPCASCGGKPRKGEKFNRHCPHPESINTYLTIVSSEPSHLTKESIICMPCYKHFKHIDKNIQEGNITAPTIHKATTSQRNTEIDRILQVLTSKQSSIYTNKESATVSDYLEYIVCSICRRVGEKMKVDQAMLLPSLYKDFVSETHTNLAAFTNVNMSNSDIPSSRWLLSRLHLYYENMLEVQCRHRRYGTMVYHKSCDLISALSAALGRSEAKCTCPNTGKQVPDEQVQRQGSSPTLTEQIQTVALYLNDKLHERARTMKASFDQTPESVVSMNLASALDNIDPNLQAFLSTMTQPVRQSRRKLFEDTPTSSELNINIKNVRVFYALSVLAFCTNTASCAPLHVLITEAVLCHGGTLELVKILNRLGAAASIETVNRLATHVVQKRLREGIQSELEPQKFAAVSIDNIDILQPFGFVSCLDATRSWHGTSVQCVQPLPLSGHLTSDDVLPTDRGDGQTKKRMCSSPANTPIPREKNKRRRRTLTEQPSPHSEMVIQSKGPTASGSTPFQATDTVEYSHNHVTLHLRDFKPNSIEQSALDTLQNDLFHCILLRKVGSSEPMQPFPGLQSLVNCVRQQAADKEVSHVSYVEIVSEKADCKPTLMGVISRLQKIFVHNLKRKYVVVVGDAKTYNLLQTIRYEYKSHLKWLIPFPGDWHILFNYQKALMKPYADAGLASLAKVAGNRAETLTSLLRASNFRRTHEFLLQAFEAMYRYFLSLYYSHALKRSPSEQEEGIEEGIKEVLSSLIYQFTAIQSEGDLALFRIRSTDLLQSESIPLKYSEFKSFMENLSVQNKTVHFWYQFISVDCFAYISLFLAIRYRNWELRTGSIKLLAAVFSAFDHQIYQILIPQHLQDVLTMPSNILHHFRKGSFSVRLSPTEWHGVALDECHEMKINKDAKLAVIHPSKHKMEFLSNYLSFRSSCVENLKRQIFPERETHEGRQAFAHSPTGRDRKRDANIKSMTEAIERKDMRELNAGDLWNFLEGKKATPEQCHDLLHFRHIGQEAYERYVSSKVLGLPSTHAPNRKKRLNTFSVTKAQKRRVKMVEQERKISQRYLKRQLAWISEKGAESLDLDSLLGPISPLPQALIGEDSLPYKATKSSATKYLTQRYSQLPLVIEHPPPSWTPHTAILEGMFMIQTSPLPTMSCMAEYAQLLWDQYIRPHFRAGVTDVHVVFDSPGAMAETPKELEQRRRDSSAGKHQEMHSCIEINSTTAVPNKWRDLLACRNCKLSLTRYLGAQMLTLARKLLSSTQTFVCNIGEGAQSVTCCGETLPCPQLWTNADEADMRLWLHCAHSTGTKKLIFSPDTDIYHVGLTIASRLPGTEIVIQLTKSFKEGSKFLLLHHLLQALHSDPDLHGIPLHLRPQALQSLYVCTGCDYVSFFKGVGKVSFLSTFFQYASFIAGGLEAPGSIGEVSLDSDSPAFLSFCRLVGATYFRAHASAFEFPSPVTLYHSVTASSANEKHEKWLQIIRNAIWLRADTESMNMPSTTALKLHWKRSLWVIQMWNMCIENDIDMPGLDGYGWIRQNGQLKIVWETEETEERAKSRVDFILKGCRCKKGCNTNRCKCKKSSRLCGPGCQCLNCTNTHQGRERWDEVASELEVEEQVENIEAEEYITDTDEEENTAMYEDEETNLIMESIFGEDTEDDFP